MTALSHLDPNFASVAALEAVNEPIVDADKTPGLGECDGMYVSYLTKILPISLRL